MQPRPLMDSDLPDYSERIWIGPPPDVTEGIEGLEGARFFTTVAGVGIVPAISVRIVLEDGDLAKIESNNGFWLTFLGGKVTPFVVENQLPVLEPDQLKPEDFKEIEEMLNRQFPEEEDHGNN